MDRLKLYDTSLEIILDSKLKRETKRIAYKNKMTMSAYIRMLIELGNKKYKKQELIKKLEKGD